MATWNTNSILNAIQGIGTTLSTTTTSGQTINAFVGTSAGTGISNTAFTQVITGATPFSLPTGTTRIRITTSINCTGLTPGEYLQAYVGLTNGTINPKGLTFTSSAPYSNATSKTGAVNPVTVTFADIIDIPSTSLPFTPQVYLASETGTHTVGWNIFISIDVLA